MTQIEAILIVFYLVAIFVMLWVLYWASNQRWFDQVFLSAIVLVGLGYILI